MARGKSCTYASFDHMAVQMTLDRYGVVLMDRSQVRTAPGPQPQRVHLMLLTATLVLLSPGEDRVERLVTQNSD